MNEIISRAAAANVVSDLLVQLEWYKAYVNNLVKAFDVPEETAALLTKISKPTIQTDAVAQYVEKLLTAEETKLTTEQVAEDVVSDESKKSKASK